MNKEKRNIATKLETESKYLTNILDKQEDRKSTKAINVNDLIKKTKAANKKENTKNIIIVAGSLSVLAVTGIIIAN